jgi:hypothetical protein
MKYILSVFLLAASIAGGADDHAGWSSVVNGLRARLVVLSPASTNTPFCLVMIEMQNVSDVAGQVKIPFTPDRLDLHITDESGKELALANGPYDGITPDWEPILLPMEGTIKFRISFGGLGYRSGTDKVIVDIGPSKVWVVPQNKKSYWLSGKFTVKGQEGDDPLMEWSGTIDLPKSKIPKAYSGLTPLSESDAKGRAIRDIIEPVTCFKNAFQNTLCTNIKQLVLAHFQESDPFLSINTNTQRQDFVVFYYVNVRLDPASNKWVRYNCKGPNPAEPGFVVIVDTCGYPVDYVPKDETQELRILRHFPQEQPHRYVSVFVRFGSQVEQSFRDDIRSLLDKAVPNKTSKDIGTQGTNTIVASDWSKPTALSQEAQAVLDGLNQKAGDPAWQSAIDMIERPETRPPNLKDSGEVTAFLSVKKQDLAKLGVRIRWNAKAKCYEAVADAK